MINLKTKLKEYLSVKKQIEDLYKKKMAIEKVIADELVSGKEVEIELDDIYQLSLTVENNIDPNLVRENFPEIFNFGQRLYFDYKQAMLALESPKDFWSLMKICRVKEHKVKVVKKNESRSYAGIRGRNSQV